MEKTRWVNPTVYVVLLALLLSTFIYLLWFSGCPGPPLDEEPDLPHQLNYLLVLPENMSYPVFRPQHSHDATRLIDLDDFAFTINNLVCNDTSPVVLSLVHSAPLNVERRASVRSTWGSLQGDSFKLLFLVGRPRDAALQAQLEEEDRTYHDLVQGSFLDVYRNLTYKHIMALKWTTYYCPRARYVLKTDDDVFVNIPALFSHIHTTLSPLGARKLLMCASVSRRVIRSYRSKWRVSLFEYRHKFYPKYCSGFVVLYSTDVVFRLYNEAQFTKYFWVDDVFVTGILASKAKLAHTLMGPYCMSRKDLDEFLHRGNLSSPFLTGPVNLGVEEVKAVWERMVLLNQTRRGLTTSS